MNLSEPATVAAIVLALAFAAALGLWLRERGAVGKLRGDLKLTEERAAMQEEAKSAMGEFLRAHAA
jgi:hypothetical protein